MNYALCIMNYLLPLHPQTKKDGIFFVSEYDWDMV